jgi:3-dehydroquinate synthase
MAVKLDLAPTAPATTSAHVAVADQLLVDIERALDDRRRIDELVAHFEYSGAVQVPAEGQQFEGQGAVKRFLTTLLHDLEIRDVRLDHHSKSGSAIVISLSDSKDQPRELHLHPASHGTVVAGATLISELIVKEVPPGHETTLPEDLIPLFGGPVATSSDGDGPKWETYDGRVRQRIWQHSDVFSSGNRFLIETMELTTGRLILMVDATVWSLYGQKMTDWGESVDILMDPIIAEANEDHKTLQTFTYMLDELKRADPLRRSEPVLAVGGGVLTDTAGFACACWRRGIPWCRLPTTLLGIVDASVGIKVAINYHRKNGVGHFFSPSHTFVDSSFLATVPIPDIRSGVGEIMKAALIHDKRLYELMVSDGERLIKERFMGSAEGDAVIKLSIDAMLECIGPDLWEEALLRPMDFGHTFSRTLEADESFYLRHGEAVAIDCIMNALIAEQKGLLSEGEASDLLDLYARLGLPCSIAGITAATYKRARDEIIVHRDGLLRAPLPAGIGGCEYADEMTDEEIDAAFTRLEKFITEHPETSWNPTKSFVQA